MLHGLNTMSRARSLVYAFSRNSIFSSSSSSYPRLRTTPPKRLFSSSYLNPRANYPIRPYSYPDPYPKPYSSSSSPISSKTKRTMSTITTASTQPVGAPLTRSATFLVLSLTSASALPTIRSTLAGLSSLAKNVSFRDPDAHFTCTVGIASSIWDGLTNLPRPKELHPFREVKGSKHTAVSTPGDLLFHIRSELRDLCFEFERQLMDLLGDSVKLVDGTVGFRYFDARDLLGFVDGTANPVGPDVPSSVLVAAEDDDPGAALGGSYVVVQKYLHDIPGWKSLPAEQQEQIIGRTKADNIELDDAEEGTQASHKTLSTIEDEAGEEHDILRDNMPFGSPAEGEFGTYFIGYTRRLWVIEKMLERMFVGNPPGLHDRLLDFSRPVTGTVFFAPSAAVLSGLDG